MKKLIILLLFSNSVFGQNPATGGYLLTKSNGAISIGTEVNTSPLTIANFTTSFVTPQVGTMIHVVSDAAVNGRISFDTYNNTSITGSNFQGRRARGTAGSPTPALADDVLVAIGADGYGVDSFTNVSVGSMNIRANGTFTNTSKPTYISFTTTPSASITQVERLRIKPDGTIQITGLNAAGFMQTDASGNITSPNAATTKTNLGLGNVTNESKATMFTSPAFTGTATGIGIPVYAQVTGSNATTTGQALVDVTGLSVALTTNAVYEFEAVMSCQTSAVTTGTAYGVNYSAAGASVEASISGSSTSTAMKNLRISALNSATALYLATSGQTGGIIIKGRVTTGANAGNLTIQHLKLTSGTSTVFVGSFLKVTRIS